MPCTTADCALFALQNFTLLWYWVLSLQGEGHSLWCCKAGVAAAAATDLLWTLDIALFGIGNTAPAIKYCSSAEFYIPLSRPPSPCSYLNLLHTISVPQSHMQFSDRLIALRVEIRDAFYTAVKVSSKLWQSSAGLDPARVNRSICSYCTLGMAWGFASLNLLLVLLFSFY